MAAPDMVMVVDTPHGAGHIVLDARGFTPGGADRPTALVVLGHGASGAWDTADLAAFRDTLTAAGCVVVRSVQPYAVAGRRLPAPVAHLDAAYCALVARAREQVAGGVPLVVGGRSNGARVAARTAAALGARALLAISFPLTPPGRPETSRAGELAAAGVPTLVVQGERDTFGTPAQLAVAVPGLRTLGIAGAGHSPRGGPALTQAARDAADWVLDQVGDYDGPHTR